MAEEQKEYAEQKILQKLSSLETEREMIEEKHTEHNK